MIVVMGATGNTGRVAAGQLLASGETVRAIGRSADRLATLAARGAEACVGDAMDHAFLTRAFRGADAVYAMIPPDYTVSDYYGHYDRVGEAITRALREAGVKKVVALSSLGAEHASGTGPIVALHRQEARLREIPGIDLLLLRPGYFMENQFANLGLIKAKGINGGAFEPDVKFAMVAVRDVGVAAAAALQAPTFHGTSVRELLGPHDTSMVDLTRAIGARIGKPDLAYVRFPDVAFREALLAAGISAGVAALFIELSHAVNDGRIHSLEGRTPANTTPTSVEHFADAFARAYDAA